MAIRIRVYPQPHSIGARRNRARRRQQQVLRQQLQVQQQLLRQQQQRMFGFVGIGGIGSAYGFGGSPWNIPAASSWGLAGSSFPGAYGSVNSAWSGAYAVPAYGYGTTGSASGMSPFGVAQHAGSGYGWHGAGC